MRKQARSRSCSGLSCAGKLLSLLPFITFMARSSSILTPTEKARLKANKVKLREVGCYAVSDLQHLLDVSLQRAREIFALYEFQSIPSIGIQFAKDLLSIGYYTLAELQDKTGPGLIHELELKTGVWQDPCVEDQCRLVVHFANHGNTGKQWWHFTAERKAYREKHGYPPDRPAKAWYELLGYPAR